MNRCRGCLGNEHGGMNEVLANLYGITGEIKYFKLAQRFNHQAVIAPAAQRIDKLTGLHANTQIPKFIGTAREYELSGQESLKRLHVLLEHGGERAFLRDWRAQRRRNVHAQGDTF